MQRSREFLVEQHQLQELPASAMIITYAGPAGRQVVMADANPGIGALTAATELTLEEFQVRSDGIAPAQVPPQVPVRGPAPDPGDDGPPAVPVSWRSGDDRPAPNLGPPPPRLDWRKRRT